MGGSTTLLTPAPTIKAPPEAIGIIYKAEGARGATYGPAWWETPDGTIPVLKVSYYKGGAGWLAKDFASNLASSNGLTFTTI